MKIKELFYKLGLKPNYSFFPATKSDIGKYNEKPIQFYNWLAPKSRPQSIQIEEINEIKSFVKEGDTALDIGAHIGDSTLPIALACGETGTVFAFEPNPIVFCTLAKNAQLNRHSTNIVPLPFACTNDTTDLTFKYSDPWLANGGDKSKSGWKDGHSFPIPVNGVNPYDFLKENYPDKLKKVRYIKIDIEGLDLFALQQLEPLIDLNTPHIKFEIAAFTTLEMRNGLIRFFERKPYEFFITSNQPPVLKSKKAEPNDFFTPESIDIFCVPKTHTPS